MGALYGHGAYGAVSGVLALVLALARAAGPVGASLLHAAGGGYVPVLVLLALCSALAAGAVLAAAPSPERSASLFPRAAQPT